jgi:phosphoribosylglycinamide formyltransferase-1/phosphoribosylamine--glycine ligase/phosphoribosylglycinamide formyltransferase/phosphoribosylformylglycinamidine cyclo-ligase
VSPDPDADLERVRAICLSEPRALEKISHGQPLFYIDKGRSFTWFLHDHHGSDTTAIAVRTSGADEQAMLIEADPDLFYRPAYIGPFGWIAIRLDVPQTDWVQIEARIATSWDLAATSRVRERFGR